MAIGLSATKLHSRFFSLSVFAFEAVNHCRIAPARPSLRAIITERESGQGWVAFLKMTHVNRAFITRVRRAYL